MRVATLGSASIGSVSAELELERCICDLAPSLGMSAAPVEHLPVSPLAIDRMLDARREAPLDLLVIDEELPGLSVISVIRELRDAIPETSILMTASDDDLAFEAQMLGVEAYVPKPVSSAAFGAAVEKALTDIAERRREAVALRFRDRARYLAKRDIVFIETINHDQVIHMRGGDKLAIRSSSQALFETLSPDTRFFKDGSSFIVNLAFVRSLGRDGSAHLAEGSTVSVPVRLRRAFAEALLSYSAG